MPRQYNLGRRAEPKADTRARIVAAALEIYRDRGLAGASNLAIARAADVAPATVRNHFPGDGRLGTRCFEALLDELRVPTPAIFEGIDSLRDRVERLALELAAFYERSEPGGGPMSENRTSSASGVAASTSTTPTSSASCEPPSGSYRPTSGRRRSSHR